VLEANYAGDGSGDRDFDVTARDFANSVFMVVACAALSIDRLRTNANLAKRDTFCASILPGDLKVDGVQFDLKIADRLL
jgi:hypothetical protein